MRPHRAILRLVAMLNLPTSPSSGHVVSFDLAAVGVDLSAVPIDEIIAFRDEHKAIYSKYRRSVQLFAYELSRMSEEELKLAFETRQSELDEIASDLRRVARRAWKKPASFMMSLAGAAWTLKTGDPFGAIFGAGAALLGFESDDKNVSAYSYLFRARERYS
jgi:hypothetical protein